MKVKNIFSLLLMVFSFAIISCEKEKEEPSGATSTMTDIDGNTYRTIKIGNQWWMAENLRVKTYRNGTPVTQSQTVNKWITENEGYCEVENDPYTTGLLYNGYAVTNNNNLAPEGWHIPSDEEWKELERQLGMSSGESDKSGWRGSTEGEKLKIESPKGWSKFQEIWSTNESGFTALAGSCRIFDGNFGDPGLKATGFWWSNSVNSQDEIAYRYLDYKTANIYRSYIEKNYGFSVRCIKN